jgi:phosphate starvation-inducible protein PhoH
MPANQQRLTKRQKRTLKQQGVLEDGNKLSGNFNISKKIVPMTETQRDAFESWDYGNNLMLHGIAGTGKTFLGLYFALKDVMSKSSTREKVFIVRSTVPSRDQGFLPGSQKQKEAVYEEPYYDIATKLFERGDAYQILKQKQIVQFASTSYLRGCTFEDCIIVVDEVQNMSAGEQDDLTSKRYNEESGLRDFMRIIERMREFDFVEFQVEDIVRSRLVKSYIIERDKLGL